jgi:hypothetical protein
MSIPSATQVGREINKFTIWGNIDGVKWPQECANCGRPPTNTDSFSMTANFKRGFNVTMKGIPYCEICYPKIKRHHNITSIKLVVTFLIGVLLSLLLMISQGQSDSLVILYGMAVVTSFAVGYGISWLLAKLIGKVFLKDKIAEPVSGELKQDPNAGNEKGVSIVLKIPREEYASKFADLNNV